MSTSTSSLHRPSAWTLVLLVVWAALAARIGIAVIQNESFGGDLSLPLIAFIVASAVVGSRVFALFQRPADDPPEPERTR